MRLCSSNFIHTCTQHTQGREKKNDISETPPQQGPPPPFQEYLGGLYLSKQLPTCLCSENKVVGIPLIGIDPKEIYGEFLYFFSCPLKSPHRPGRLSEIGAPDVREMPTAARNLTRNSFLCLSQNPRRPKRKIIKLNPTK